MSKLTDGAIRANLEALAAPADWAGCQLAGLAERLCALQQTLSPVTTPRRLVLFAADHGPDEESVVGPAIREIAAGEAATAVLARHTNADLVLVDVGSRCHPLHEHANYRCRKVCAVSRGSADGAALTADEFRAAFDVGQKEADSAAAEGFKLVAVDAVGKGGESAAARVRERLATLSGDEAIPALAHAGGADVAAAAGFIAKAAESRLAIVIAGPVAAAAAEVAEQLCPGAAARCIRPTPPTPLPAGRGEPTANPERQRRGAELHPVADAPGSPEPNSLSLQGGGWGVGFAPPSDGISSLLAFQLLDAAAAVMVNAARRIHWRDQVVPVRRRKVAVFTGSFDPPTTFHRRVVESLRGRGFDEVIVRPVGPRNGHDEVEHASPIHRAVMADLAFRGLPGVAVDLSDLDDGVFTPHAAFDDLFADRGEVWHVVSDEFVSGGRGGQSWIQTKWEMGEDMWAAARFVILHPGGAAPDPADLPPKSQLVTADGHVPTCDIRLRVFQGGAAHPDVPEAVESYIRRYGLFSGQPSPRETRVRLSHARFKIVYDERNEKARGFAERFRRYESGDPTHVLVIGGDGTMLQAIRDHWRLRLPFVGLNAGTLGFLMNESLPAELENTELVLYRMPMLRVDAGAPDGRRSQHLACADAWVERDSGQAAWLRIDVDGRTQVPRVVGDGLLVATPSGSSAYARAMGATPVPLTAPVLTLAGSNVFRPRFWQPVTLPESAAVAITSLDHNGKRPIRGFIDGRPLGLVRSLDIRVSSVAAVELGFTPEFDLSARLLRSMFPPAEM